MKTKQCAAASGVRRTAAQCGDKGNTALALLILLVCATSTLSTVVTAFLGENARTREGTKEPKKLPHLELVADADEAEFAGLLLRILAAVGALEELADELVPGLAHQALQGHVQGVVVLLHEASLPTRTHPRT